jgi:hypothetical protein
MGGVEVQKRVGWSNAGVENRNRIKGIGGRYAAVSIAQVHAGNRRQISPGRIGACLRCLSSVPINIKPHSTGEPSESSPAQMTTVSRFSTLPTALFSSRSTYTPGVIACVIFHSLSSHYLPSMYSFIIISFFSLLFSSYHQSNLYCTIIL